MFCAISTTIERCKTEGVVDVFQVVKALRGQKPGAVRTVVSCDHTFSGWSCVIGYPSLPQVQYQIIFEAILVFLDTFETYANIQK